MAEDWRNALGILMCTEICDGTGAGICADAPLTYSSSKFNWTCSEFKEFNWTSSKFNWNCSKFNCTCS